MRKDASSIARYFIFLIIVFVAWVFILHKLSKSGNFQTFFGGSKTSSLYILGK